MTTDDYAHPVGQVSKHMIKSAVKLMDEADAAERAGDHDRANKLNEDARQHTYVANVLDAADEAYKIRNSD